MCLPMAHRCLLEHASESLLPSNFRAATLSIPMASMIKNQVLGIPGHEKGWCNKSDDYIIAKFVRLGL